VASTREKSELYAASGKLFAFSSPVLMGVHVVQQIDSCFKRKSNACCVESKLVKPAAPESEQPRSGLLRKKWCTCFHT